MSDEQQASPNDDYDSPWKEIIERFFPQLLDMFLPEAYEDIDWSKGWESRDKELRQIVREAKQGSRIADKLLRVHRKSGAQSRVFVHVEVQGQKEADFSERIYIYNYRIYDRYGGDVVSIGILADASPHWRPNAFERSLWGCRAGIEYPVIKLRDYRDRWDELQQSSNPLALVVMAHLKTQATKRVPASRLRWKIDLVKWLYGRGYARRDVLELLRALDWMMTLPSELEREFDRTVTELETSMGRPYVTSWERRGRAEGREEGKAEGVRQMILLLGEDRLGPPDAEIESALSAISDVDRLQHMARRLLKAKTWTDLLQL
jgi:hypothetical protein